jgi:stage II sporulation SpoM-like protein
MGAEDYALVRGMDATRAALRRWNSNPWDALSSWLYLATGIAVTLLGVVLVVATIARPDPTHLILPGLTDPATPGDVASVLMRNSLVLALHATACVAGFIAGSSLPLTAERRTGLSRWVHERARPVALAWVVLVTCFSLSTQAYVLGSSGSTLADQLHISRPELILSVLPHALPELVALFLPLAAWTIASRRDGWEDLLAATFATVAIATPVLVIAATWEVYAWPHILALLSPVV